MPHENRSPKPARSSGPFGARYAVALLLLLLSVGVAPATSVAQEAPPAITPPSEIETQRLTARLAELSAQEQAGELSAGSVQELTLLRETQAFLEQGAAARASADRFAAEGRTAPEQLAQIETYLATPADQLVTPIDRSASLDTLNGQLEAARVRRQTEQELRAKVDTDEQFRAKRRSEIPSERGLATERLDALGAALATQANPDESTDLTTARRWHALAEQFLRQANLRALDEELRNYDARRSLLEKRRAYRDRRVAIETTNASTLQEVISSRQVALAEAAQQDAARQRRDSANAHPLVRTILDRNQALTARNTEILGFSGTDALDKTQAETKLLEWRTAFVRSEARVNRAGLTNAIGQHLRSQRLRLPDANAIKRGMDERDERIGALVNEAEDLSLERESLIDVDDAAVELLARYQGELPLPPVDSVDREELRLAARDALLQQREYVSTLSTSINDYLDDTLLELQNTQRELRDLIVSYTIFIDERILWTRSAEVVNKSDVRAAGRALAWLADEQEWASIGAHLRNDLGANVPLFTLCLPLLIALLLARPELRRRLRAAAEDTKRYTSDRFAVTATALLVTVLLAGAAPAWMAFTAWRLSSMEAGLGTGLSAGLFRAAELLFLFGLIALLCRPGGVAVVHFRTKPMALQVVRRHLRWFMPVMVPLSFIVGVTTPNDNYHDSLGRIAFIAGMVALALFLQRLAKPSSALVRTVMIRRQGGWLDRLTYVWYPLLVAAPIAVAFVASIGYLYSAIQLESRVLDTVWLVLAVLVGRASLLRALFLTQRRLDMEQRRKKRAAETEAGKAALTTAAGSHPVAIADTPGEGTQKADADDVDLASVSAQTRKLLYTAVVFTMLVGVAVVWRDMLPALNFFQEISLWSPDAPVVSTVTAAGAESVASLPGTEVPAAPAGQAGSITLADLIYSMLILLVTALVSTNIPGLLEIVLLQRLPISPSGRYAITTLARYLLVIVGVAMAFGAIGIGWSKVQWLVAAMTVGLGFGLQEIFANFVSGLIILFERPVRVGDTVTVGGITGQVAQLRIRATTITDWDRKELIIPNKEFVTGQIINWTLTDPILRVTVKVGIAYGSDTQLAEQLMLQVAADDPVVLKEPAPSVVFAEFGDSSLNFRLRVFIPQIDNLFGVTHRLHGAIDRAFRESGIVIAFPQRDVHIHQVPMKPDSSRE